MDFKNEEAKQKWEDYKDDIEGKGMFKGPIIGFVKRWTAEMDHELSSGNSIAEVQEDARKTADIEGLTPEMYTEALSITKEIWQHGDELK